MIKSKLFQFILGSLFGAAIASGILGIHERHAMAAPAEPQKSCANVMGQAVTQEGWDFAQQAIRTQHATIEQLKAELAEARANPAVQLLAQSGHVMNEEQCRAWLSFASVPTAATSVPMSAAITTILYESGRASLNVSLLPLPGAPRVAIGPHSELAPRWIIPGRIQPQMIGETRKAVYYSFDVQASQWQGPFAPERVAQ